MFVIDSIAAALNDVSLPTQPTKISEGLTVLLLKCKALVGAFEVLDECPHCRLALAVELKHLREYGEE